jgi:hypothetical protein
MDTFHARSGSESAIGQEIITRDDRIDRADCLGKTAGPARTLRSARVVRIPKEDGIIEVEDQVMRGAPQGPELPRRQEFALENHGVEPPCAAQLEYAREKPAFQGFAGQGTTRF